MGHVVPIASQLGISTEELFGEYATLTGVTGNTRDVTTQLRGVLASILKPSAEAQKMATSLGLAWNQEAVRAKGLRGVLVDMMVATGGNAEMIAQLVPSVEALPGVLALAGSQADTFRQKIDAMRSSTGEMEKAFTAATDTTATKWNRMTATVKDVMIDLGETLTPVLEPIITDMGRWVEANREIIGQKVKEWLDGALAVGKVFAEWLAGLAAKYQAIREALDHMIAQDAARNQASEKAITADEEHAANMIELIRLQQQLMDMERGGHGMSQKDLDALLRRYANLQAEQYSWNANQRSFWQRMGELWDTTLRDQFIDMQKEIERMGEALRDAFDPTKKGSPSIIESLGRISGAVKSAAAGWMEWFRAVGEAAREAFADAEPETAWVDPRSPATTGAVAEIRSVLEETRFDVRDVLERIHDDAGEALDLITGSVKDMFKAVARGRGRANVFGAMDPRMIQTLQAILGAPDRSFRGVFSGVSAAAMFGGLSGTEMFGGPRPSGAVFGPWGFAGDTGGSSQGGYNPVITVNIQGVVDENLVNNQLIPALQNAMALGRF